MEKFEEEYGYFMAEQSGSAYACVELIANALDVSVDWFIISDLKHPELIYLKDICDKIQTYPLRTRIVTCEMIQHLLEVVDESQK